MSATGCGVEPDSGYRFAPDSVPGRLSLTTSDGTGLWDLARAAETVLLTLANDPGAPPPTVLRLLR